MKITIKGTAAPGRTMHTIRATEAFSPSWILLSASDHGFRLGLADLRIDRKKQFAATAAIPFVVLTSADAHFKFDRIEPRALIEVEIENSGSEPKNFEFVLTDEEPERKAS
jgi:hypothetical protein